MTTKIIDVSRAKEKRFIDEANRPLNRAKIVGRLVGLLFLVIPIITEVVDFML